MNLAGWPGRDWKMWSLTNMGGMVRILLMAIALLASGCAFGPPVSTVTPPDSVRSHKVVRTAYAQIGRKYRAGGCNPAKGFDCSGLVWWAYGQHGIKLPRITTDQARAGRKIAPASAMPGDILVFKTGQSPRGLHTGIYAGNQKFIHSPGTGKAVCLENLRVPYWKTRLLAVRRVEK